MTQLPFDLKSKPTSQTGEIALRAALSNRAFISRHAVDATLACGREYAEMLPQRLHVGTCRFALSRPSSIIGVDTGFPQKPSSQHCGPEASFPTRSFCCTSIRPEPAVLHRPPVSCVTTRCTAIFESIDRTASDYRRWEAKYRHTDRRDSAPFVVQQRPAERRGAVFTTFPLRAVRPSSGGREIDARVRLSRRTTRQARRATWLSRCPNRLRTRLVMPVSGPDTGASRRSDAALTPLTMIPPLAADRLWLVKDCHDGCFPGPGSAY